MSLAHVQKNEDVQDTYDLIKSRKDEVPTNIDKRSVYESTEVDFDANDYFGSFTSMAYPKWNFEALNFKIYSSKPIEVIITRQNKNYFAENETLDVYAIGSSEGEAIDDFCHHLIYFYKYYKKLSWDEVTGHAVKLKRLYGDVFQEIVYEG